MPESNEEDRPILMFDGECNLCNGFVDFILRKEKDHRFLFASLQSERGRQLQEQFAIAPTVDSVIVINDKAAYLYSDAVFQVMKALPWYFRLLLVLRVVPKAGRDRLYRLVAKNRYRLFGKRESCRLPTAEEKSRFLQ
ncbi:thiol-disulfide oxidoreductase DCC family protein [Halalkalibacter oceani]|uniref:Thiol-disulfide oxidoreductase DCC family protein n=1 Tax=Halalkalibacter oceani TaxID=1653776 RepID=A0A9X2DP42_9BACI|nr:thiol-disulfide oxidoreductase DCC family protein [Halalkalibacter oceani]MCM3714489.1 thiol-disulfide oxidoreductase DCC family protein [Halalkalibacter oceani]